MKPGCVYHGVASAVGSGNVDPLINNSKTAIKLTKMYVLVGHRPSHPALPSDAVNAAVEM